MLGACFSLLLISSATTLLILGEAAPSPSATISSGEEWTLGAAADIIPTPHKTSDTDCSGEDALCPQQNYMELCSSNPQLCDELLEAAKRAQGFSSWGGKRVPFQSWGGKRIPFQSWGGKRVPVPFGAWGGKRVPFSNWGGKRSGEDEEKRSTFNSWGGKRTLLEDEKRATFNAWGGKRGGFSSWGGKRAADSVFYNWGGKRPSEEELRNKRAVTVKRASNPARSKINRLLDTPETVAIRRGGTVDFFPWGGKRSTQNLIV